MLEICLLIFVSTAIYEILKMMWPQFFIKVSRVRKEACKELLNVLTYERNKGFEKASAKCEGESESVTKPTVKKAELKVLLAPSSLDVDRTSGRKQRNKKKAA